jgi:hypothetical protein
MEENSFLSIIFIAIFSILNGKPNIKSIVGKGILLIEKNISRLFEPSF